MCNSVQSEYVQKQYVIILAVNTSNTKHIKKKQQNFFRKSKLN